jgi:peptidoglycan/xylan/chitin deacetylase (PgdA/CDA1 family)
VSRARATAAALLVALAAGCGAGDARHTARADGPAVPILVYHHLGDPPKGERNRSLWVTPTRFAQQLDALRRAGFHGVTLARVWDAWHGRGTLPAKPVVITFDDGYGPQDTIARPALARRGWAGVLNLQLNRVGLRGGLSREAIRRMVDAGWEVDDHTTTHPDLTKVSPARLRAEVAGSRAKLRRELGIDTRFFCYPFGRVNARVRAAVRAAGFFAATTIVRDRATPADDPLELPRIIAGRAETPAELVRLAQTGR